MGAYVKGLSPEGRDALREALWNRFLPNGADGPFTFQAKVRAVRGTAPAKSPAGQRALNL